MWRPVMFLLCLIAALSATPLRQAEAAGDLARSMGEMVGGYLIEEIDGGVGDDSGETILRAGGPSPSSLALESPAMDDALPNRADDSRAMAPGGDDRRPGGSAFAPPGSPSRRQAWLQCFLF